jgi:AcrR family transcriptional regulator
MSVQDRRAREREKRHRLIVTTALELAEAEGWDAVTTRRLAEAIEYSQPVLYSHFSGKDAIVRAVAIEGFVELAAALRAARRTARSPRRALLALARAYLEFAHTRPALYDAMFNLAVLPFARPETPNQIHEGFDEFRQALAPLAAPRDVDTLGEVFWSALHGLATLSRSHRLRPDHAEQRLALLVGTVSGGNRGASSPQPRLERRPANRPGGIA